jgi:hypothetical protein
MPPPVPPVLGQLVEEPVHAVLLDIDPRLTGEKL